MLMWYKPQGWFEIGLIISALTFVACIGYFMILNNVYKLRFPKDFMEKAISRDEAIKKIKEVILSTAEKYGIEIDKIILFGSRARGDYEESSDWDILVVTKEKLNRERKIDFWYKIYKEVEIPIDIIIVSKEIFEKYKESKGFIYSYAISEGRVVWKKILGNGLNLQIWI